MHLKLCRPRCLGCLNILFKSIFGFSQPPDFKESFRTFLQSLDENKTNQLVRKTVAKGSAWSRTQTKAAIPAADVTKNLRLWQRAFHSPPVDAGGNGMLSFLEFPASLGKEETQRMRRAQALPKQKKHPAPSPPCHSEKTTRPWPSGIVLQPLPRQRRFFAYYHGESGAGVWQSEPGQRLTLCRNFWEPWAWTSDL